VSSILGRAKAAEREIEIPPDGPTLDELELKPNGERVRRNRRPFIKGPLDWEWLCRAHAAGRSALLVGLDIWRKAGMSGPGDWVVANSTTLSRWMSRSCYCRSLDCLERAGLVVVDGKAGAAARVKLVMPPPTASPQRAQSSH
jgi:hypothetical protein